MFAEVTARSTISRLCYFPIHVMCFQKYPLLSRTFCRHVKRLEKSKMLFGLAVNEGKLTSQRTRLKKSKWLPSLSSRQKGLYLCFSVSRVRESVSKSLFIFMQWIIVQRTFVLRVGCLFYWFYLFCYLPSSALFDHVSAVGEGK